ncbi:Na/Pi cotransporter family protein [bacterium]|nr:Na/Pi cotransporter family protein [bacterium]
MTNDYNITLLIFQILGGVTLFLYGIRKVTKSLEDFAGASLKLVVTRMTNRRLRGFLLGLMVALSLQSSAAVMLMIVALSNNGLLLLMNAVGIILGAGVGSTLTVQLLAFKIHPWAPAMLLFGFILMKITRSDRMRDIGGAIFSFGLVFLGMHLITEGTTPLVKEAFFSEAIGFFSRTPFFAAVLAAGITLLFQSSAATLGLLLTLGFSGIIDVETALPFIVGANIGSCGIAFIGAASGGSKGKRVAWTELIIRSCAGIIVFVLSKYYIELANYLSDNPARAIAHLHTMFALSAAIVFLPFNKPLSKIVEKIVPASDDDDSFKPIYLEPNAMNNPSLALGSAAREILRQGDIVLSMLEDIMIALEEYDRELLIEIVERDDRVDIEQEAITDYLTRLTESELSAKESRTELELLTITLELEHIADVVSKNLSQHVVKRLDMGYYFSKEGLVEIREFHNEVKALLKESLDLIALRDTSIAKDIIEKTKEIIKKQRQLNRNHIERLHAGVKYSSETSTIHLDLISDLSRIAIHVSYIAYAILGKV